jgi:hypothetical protein
MQEPEHQENSGSSIDRYLPTPAQVGLTSEA